MKLEGKVRDFIRESFYLFDDAFNLASNRRLEKNIELKNKHAGERVFLLLTGESIQQIDIKKLKNEVTYGSNLIILHEDIKDINLTYFSNLDDNRILKPNLEQWPAPKLGELGNNGSLKFYREIDNRLDSDTVLILNSVNYRYYIKEPSFKKRKIYFCKKGKNLSADARLPTSNVADMTKRLQGGGSVYYSLLMLMYMGFEEIYLCGAGYTYDPLYYLHFYDMDHFIEPISMDKEYRENQVRKKICSYNKKYSSDLEAVGFFEKDGFCRPIIIREHNKNMPLLKYHNIISRYAESQGIKIINIVPDGFGSPIYEKKSWENIEKTL